jgi:hypothetical protein
MNTSPQNKQTKQEYIASLSPEDQEIYNGIVQTIKSFQAKKRLTFHDYVTISVKDFTNFLLTKEVFTSDGKIQKFLKKLEDQKIIAVDRKGAGKTNGYKVIHYELTLPALKGWIPLDDPRYIKRNSDLLSEVLLQLDGNNHLEEGIFIKIQGASQTGKTSLLKRIEDRLINQGFYVGHLDFKTYNFLESFNNLETFAQVFIESVYEEFKDLLNSKFNRSQINNFSWYKQCTTYLEDQIFKQLTPQKFNQPSIFPQQPIILLIDNLHEVLGTEAQKFLDLLRDWFDNNIKTQKWHRISIIVAYSVEHYDEWDERNSPLANIDAQKIELTELNQDQILDLARSYGIEWSEGIEEVTKLMNLIGGHPYLVNQALYSIANEKLTLEILEEKATALDSPFCYHLNNYQQILNQKQNRELRKLYLNILNKEQLKNTQLARFAQLQLLKIGLIKLDANQQPQVRCELYQRYFQDILWEEENAN